MNFKSLIIIALSCVLVAASCARDVVMEDFESGNLQEWTVLGDAFQVSGNLSETQCSYVPEDVKGYEGGSWLCSVSNGSVSGTLTSAPFIIGRNYINFLLGGSSGWLYSGVSVRLMVEGEKVDSISPVGNDPLLLEWMSMNVEKYKGKMAEISVVVEPAVAEGNRVRKQGFILLDQITMSNREFSDWLPEYCCDIKVQGDYILVPGSNSGQNSRLSVNIDGVNILGTPQRVSVATDAVDYYIPVDVRAYKGKTAQVTLIGVRKAYEVYGGIGCDNDMRIVYDETYRPVYHFAPLFGWTNDPNGMVYKDGEWHLSYQYNPYGTTHGNMHWGHAVSRDLISWEHLPFVIAPDELGAVFSGSAVVDSENTAGMGKDAIVAIYTSAGSGQRQSIAYSLDNGRTYSKYDGNPVLADPDQRDFRDPKVSWIDGKWVMSLAVGDVIRFYGSDNLKEWEYLSEFGRGIGSHAAVWECPDLLKMSVDGKEKWVLLVSINPGGPNGGSVTQYFIGDFDGVRFKADPLPYPLWVDLGTDNYAGVTFGNLDGRHVFMGWMSNWWYANATPTRYFRNSMTLPRELGLKYGEKHLILASTPSPEVFAARASSCPVADFEIDGEWTMDRILQDNSGAYEIDMTVIPVSGRKMEMSLLNGKGEKAVFSFDFDVPELVLDRSQSGLTDFSPRYVTEPIVTPLVKRDEYRIQLFVDKASTEMFINDGDVVFTNCIFPTEALNTLTLRSVSGTLAVKDMTIHEMKSN